MKYSNDIKGFYPADLSGYADVPDDLIEITDAEYRQALTIVNSGGTLAVVGGELVITTAPPPTIEQIKTRKINEINAAAGAAIVAEFQSSAIGSQHTYASGLVDQQNLSASVLASLIPGNPEGWATYYLCGDAEGAWDYRPHTAAQIQQVGTEQKARIVALLVRAQTLKIAVGAATDVETVQAVAWDD